MITLWDYQKEAREFLLKHPSSILADEPGMGKAQGLDALVLTPTGYTRMENVKVGTVVIGKNGYPTTVTGVYPQGERPVFRVLFNDGTHTECDADHLWSVTTKTMRRDGKCSRIVKTTDLAALIPQNIQVPLVDPVQFTEKRTVIDPWVMGYLLGNGHFGRKRVSVSVPNDTVRDMIVERLPNTLELNKNNSYDYTIRRKKGVSVNILLEYIRSIGLSEKHSYDKFIPEELLLNSVNSRVSLLQGLLDSDGSVVGNSTIEYSTTSKKLSEGVVFLIQSLGGVARVTPRTNSWFTYKGERKQGLPSYRVIPSLPNTIQPFLVYEKLCQYSPRTKYFPMRKVSGIEFVGTKKAQCISVDAKDHLYVTNDFIVTHNSFPAVSAGNDIASNKRKLIIAPPYLLEQWGTVISAYSPDVPWMIVARKDAPVPKEFTGWVIVNYHMFMNEGMKKHPELLTYAWGAVIADESHRLRGRKSQWTKNILKIKSDYFWMLTGTPIVNNPGDLWPLLRIIDRVKFSSYWKFVGTWCETETTPWTTIIKGVNPDLEVAFADMLNNYMLRRNYETVINEEFNRTGVIPAWTDLPLETNHVFDMPPSMRKAHDTAKKEWFIEHPDLDDPVAISSGGALVAKLRQLTAGFVVEDGAIVGELKENPKVSIISEYLDDHELEPAIVFTWFRGTCQMIARHLREKNDDRPVYEIRGGMATTERNRLVEEWKTRDNGIIVATLASLTEGVNLQHSSLLLFAEQDYLPSTIQQAIARARRAGQTSRVRVINVLAKDSIDTAVNKALAFRDTNIRRALLETLRENP
jgi:hypothetical protein